MSRSIVITRELSGDHRVRTPDGDYSIQPSKNFAEAKARQWMKEHGEQCEIEWRNGVGR